MRIGSLTGIALVLTLAANLAVAGPQITFDKENHDYGKIRYGETVTEEFVFSNTGDGTLVIEDLKSSCGCTNAVKGSREIPPNGKSKIVAAFDTTGLRAGAKVKTIFVHSNDPDRPVVKLIVRADVVKELNVEPPSIAKQLKGFTEEIPIPMKLTNSSAKAYKVTGFQGDPTGLTVRMNPGSFDVPAESTVPFTVTLVPDKAPSRVYYMGKLQLLTDHPQEADLEVRYLIKLDKAQ